MKIRAGKNEKNNGSPYPMYVKLNTGEKLLYRELVAHEKLIIEDNIFFGIKNGYPEDEIEQYKREAYAQLKALKTSIRENPDILLMLDRQTERYMPAAIVIK